MHFRHMFIVCFILLCAQDDWTDAILFQQDNEARNVKELDGLWWFVREKANSHGDGFSNKWFNKDLATFTNATLLPVPCAFNDVTQDVHVRDHVGWVWYQRQFYVSDQWKNDRIVLRFGSVNYFAAVFVNGLFVMNHTGGHLPFEAEIRSLVHMDIVNNVTVAVNNTLSHASIPPGEFIYKGKGMDKEVQRDEGGRQKIQHPEQPRRRPYPDGFFEQIPDFDFFNYAGILRSVYLYTTDTHFIQDIRLFTTIDGRIEYSINISAENDSGNEMEIVLKDKEGREIERRRTIEREGTMHVNDPQLWWPRAMGHVPAYLYTLQVHLFYSQYCSFLDF